MLEFEADRAILMLASKGPISRPTSIAGLSAQAYKNFREGPTADRRSSTITTILKAQIRKDKLRWSCIRFINANRWPSAVVYRKVTSHYSNLTKVPHKAPRTMPDIVCRWECKG